MKSIPFRLIEQKEETNQLVIVLPGAGYSTQAPLLHFTTGLFYNKGFDVLHLNYAFTRQEMAELKGSEFVSHVQSAIDNAITNKTYNHFYIVAKSIGTIALSGLLNNPLFQDAKVVWLTPLLQRDDVFQVMIKSKNKGFFIIGDNDFCFKADRFESLKENENLSLKVIEGGDHSLELAGETIKSIDLLKDVTSWIEEFIDG